MSSIRQTAIFLSSILISLFFTASWSAETGNAYFVKTYFSGSGLCADCHNSLQDNTGKDISIETDWATSMMANGTRDPYWQAKVASELHRNPQLRATLNDKCSRCHAPMAHESVIRAGELPQIFTQGANIGFLDPVNADYFDMAMDSISCTACHQIEDNGKLGTLEGISGKFVIDDYVANGTEKIDRPAYGQYTKPRKGPMQNDVEFTPELGTHTSTSEFCATCHDLKTPFVDANGDIASTTPESEFPEQMAYTEWDNSDFADGKPLSKTCQQCHMPKVDGTVKISTRPPSLEPRPDFSRHTFHGANTVMLDMLKRNRAALGVSASEAGLKTAIADTRSFLKQAASIHINFYVLFEGNLRVNLRVSNHSGHKFPSGYPSRRAYVHFTLKNASTENILFESGRISADGRIAGVATDEDTTTFETHYQEITDEHQVQVYEPIMANTDDDVTHTLLRAAYYVKDNRLLPVGFDKSMAPSDVAVRGDALGDPDFIGGQDDITYAFEPLNLPTKVAIEAEIRYQPLAYGHLQDLLADSGSVPEVNSFKTMFENSNTLRDELIGSTKLDIDSSSPACSGTDIPLHNMDIKSEFTCAADNSISASNFIVSTGNGHAQLTASSVILQPGFNIVAPATLKIITL